jgi:hypothetical protein
MAPRCISRPARLCRKTSPGGGLLFGFRHTRFALCSVLRDLIRISAERLKIWPPASEPLLAGVS